MKIIIPAAGLGTRLRPHTYSKPKPLLYLAGKPVLGHILDRLASLPIEEIIFIVGKQGDQLESYVSSHYPHYQARYLAQTDMLGQSHALFLAKDFVAKDLLLIFADTIFEAEFSALDDLQADGLMFVKRVQDPSRFGVVQTDEQGFVTHLVEKPATFVSDKAVIGVIYFKNTTWLFEAIAKQFTQNLQTKGEFFLADALTIMLNEGAKFATQAVEIWEDCGTKQALLQTNKYLLSQKSVIGSQAKHSVIIPPVFIATNVEIERSVIGPNVSIDEGAVIKDCIIQNSIINQKAVLQSVILEQSIIGVSSEVSGLVQSLNIGDDCTIDNKLGI